MPPDGIPDAAADGDYEPPRRRARHYLDVEEGEGSVVDLANQAVQNKINSKLDPRPPVEELPPNFNMDPRRPQEFSCLTAYHR